MVLSTHPKPFFSTVLKMLFLQPAQKFHFGTFNNINLAAPLIKPVILLPPHRCKTFRIIAETRSGPLVPACF
jgi:hypothetical protein